MPFLDAQHPCFDYDLAGTTVRYSRCGRTGIVEFSCFPTAMAGQISPPREVLSGPHIDGLPARWKPVFAQVPEWLVQFKLAGFPEPGGHQVGRSLRGAVELNALSFSSLDLDETANRVRITATVRHPAGYRLAHILEWGRGKAFFELHTEFHNESSRPCTLEYLPSFSLGGVTPFDSGEAAERLRLHRFRSAWSAEGRHDVQSLEELHLERSWGNFSRRVERFGQVGSMPVRGFFPWAALDDCVAGVMWGVQLSAPGSWHIEVGRTQDKVTLSGGLPSRDFGEWWKEIAPGQSFVSPTAVLACVRGNIDDLCVALTSAQVAAAERQPAWDHELPVIFNEWCSSWGEPTREAILTTARKLAETRTKVFVIDDGWAEKPPGEGIQFNGDWNVNFTRFPGGLRPTCDALRELGLIPGLWFELEAATEGTEAFALEDRHLRREGRLVQVGSRHFWDLRDPLTQEHLARKVICRLRDDGFGYLKIDYNDSLPAGVDGAESPGEGLRQHLAAVQEFIARIRRELPDLLIENCSSGGHRLEPSFQALCAMGAFSDAHETPTIPLIAANLHRLILPRQSQIWCVVHAGDSLQRMRFGLAATFLGRVCLSGEIEALDAGRFAEITAALAFYERAVPVIRDGRTRLHRALGSSWNAPRGWQVVERHTDSLALIVAHTFGGQSAYAPVVPLPEGKWRVSHVYGDATPNIDQHVLHCGSMGSFSATAFLLERH